MNKPQNKHQIKNVINKIFKVLKLSKIKLYILLIFGLLLSLLEVLSIGILVPILSYFFETKNNVNLIITFKQYFFFINEENYLYFILSLILFFYIFRFFFVMYINIYKLRYLYEINIDLSKNFLNSIFKKSIFFRSNKNSSEFLNLISTINSFSQGTLLNIFNIFNDSLILLCLLIFLFFFDIEATIIIFVFFGILSFYFYIYYKKKMFLLGKARHLANENKIKNLNEIFTGFKEILLSKTSKYFLNKFNIHNDLFANTSINEEKIRILPKHFLELLVIFFFVLTIIVFHNSNEKTNEIILKIGIFSVVILKILPIINRLVTSFHNLKNMAFGSQRILNYLHNMQNKKISNISRENNRFFDFKKIKIKNIFFDYNKYKNRKNYLIKNLNFLINKNDVVGISGKSGSGKSTFVDIFSGLIDANEGEIIIDGKKLYGSFKSLWQSNIGYVPQKSIILDNSLVENINFGFNIKPDIKKIKELISLLSIDEFILSEKDMFQKKLGESGLKISGGQAQRIGMARVLYRKPQIYIFDESTNAMDVNLEKKIISKILNTEKSKTFLFISHREETLSFCNKILKF